MNKILISLIWFVSVFVFIYLLEIFFHNRKAKEKGVVNISVEAKYLIYRYKLDIKKISIKRIISDTSLIEAFDIAFVYAFVTYFVRNIYFGLVMSFVILIPVILVSYDIVGRRYAKSEKGKS